MLHLQLCACYNFIIQRYEDQNIGKCEMTTEHPPYLGFSSGSGSLRPKPTGFLSASSPVRRCSSASTFPLMGDNNDRWHNELILRNHPDSLHTVSSNSSSSFLATKGHQPLILFCLKMETMGISASLVTIPMVHCLAVFAPRGKWFRSSSIAPLKEHN